MTSENPGNTEKMQEREEALASLNSILKTTKAPKPRNMREGVKSGVSNIVAGAVGAAGIAVVAPTMGAVAGGQSAGVIGGVAGFTGGVVVGAVGAVGLALGGAIAGVSQIVQGVVAAPRALQAAKEGEWWNEVEQRWVSTNMDNVQTTLQDVPEDDRDILKKIEDDIDASVNFGAADDGVKMVKDMHYYNILEVDPSAEQSALKRKYYLLARQYHPDKHPGDNEAADKFKDIAEAYQVLSDPILRKKYDQEGMDGLSPDKTQVANAAQNVDPALLFAFLFGSDKFKDYIGRLATATSASIGDSEKLPAADARMVQIRRTKRLAVKLAAKLQPFVEKDDIKAAEAECKQIWSQDAHELCKASYGHQLVVTIGQAYMLTALQFLGSVESGVGLPSISRWASGHYARMQSKQAATKNTIEGISSGLDMMTMQEKLKVKLQEAKSDSEKEAIAKEMENAASTALLNVLWTTTVVDVTSTLHEVAQMIFFDKAVDKDARKKRALGLKVLGQTFMDCPPPPKESGQEKNAKELYEEAAFAAMLETMKQKDEAAFQASR